MEAGLSTSGHKVSSLKMEPAFWREEGWVTGLRPGTGSLSAIIFLAKKSKEFLIILNQT